MSRATYTALCERSGDWWAIKVPQVPGVHSQARRLDRVEAMARDAIGLILDVDEDSFDVELDIRLPDSADAALGRLAAARAQADAAQKEQASAAHQAAEALVKNAGMTVRDAGRILGVSFQRVDQLLRQR